MLGWLIIGIWFLLCPRTGYAAQEKEMKQAVLCVDGYSIGFLEANAALVKYNGNIMVPLDYFCRVIRAEYTMDEEEKICQITIGENEIQIFAGKKYLLFNGIKKKLTVKSRRIHGTLYVGWKAIRTMGMSAKYDKKSSRTKELGYEGAVLAVNTKNEPIQLRQKKMHSKAVTFSSAKETDQLVLVRCTGGSKARVSLHERLSNGRWKQRFECNGYIGANGYGKEREGDKKTPLGAYHLTEAFGILDDPGAQLKYTKVTPYHYWCDDSSLPYYNQLVDVRDLGVASVSGEHLIDYQGYYNYGVFIDYNVEGIAGKGSCIFLHCCAKAKQTSGCVSISEKKMAKILRKIREGAMIVIYTA